MIKVLIDWTAYDPKKHDPNERERRRKWKYQLSVFSALSVLSVSLTWIITDAEKRKTRPDGKNNGIYQIF